MPQIEQIITTVTYPRMHPVAIMHSSRSNNNQEITNRTLNEVVRMGPPMEVDTTEKNTNKNN